MGDSSAAAAPASVNNEVNAALRARAAAAFAGSGFTSGTPAVGAALTSHGLATCARQVEDAFARVNARFYQTWAEMSATVCFAREIATACADQVANFHVVLRQFVENSSGRVTASRDAGDAQERHRQKAQIMSEMATWNKVSTA